MLDLFLAELWRSLLFLRRYPLELLGAVVTLSLLFYLLFLGARFLAGPGAEFGGRLEAVLVGYLLWTFTLSAYNGLSFGLMEEAQTGTLEQVFLTPYGPIPLFLVRNLAGLLSQGLLVFLVALALMALTGAQLAFTPAVVLPFLVVLLGAYGLGFAMASLALLYKRVGQLLGLSQFLLLFLLQAPGEGPFLLLPLAPGASLARGMLAAGTPLEPLGLLLALLNSLAYFLLGLFLFRLAVKRARRLGLLHGH
ncbi:ABC transporter permease [Thermus sediminis]|uniref:ABC transporter permease n=1 Tax=Thermus sediminis TaxID=1761908 RepID=UPI000E3EC92F|nr:ABC transporter permease [Thermus sediminis]